LGIEATELGIKAWETGIEAWETGIETQELGIEALHLFNAAGDRGNGRRVESAAREDRVYAQSIAVQAMPQEPQSV
jgi:hypothetical protein